METIKSKYLDRILKDFQLMSEIVLKQLSIVRGMLEKGNSKGLNEELEKNESIIDSLDIKIREEVINAIFLFNPKAVDLRKIIAYNDMTNYLERIGDLILNVSHFLLKSDLTGERYDKFSLLLKKMLKNAEMMVKGSVFSFSCEDNTMAYETISIDDKVDNLYSEINEYLQLSFEEKMLSSQDVRNILIINSISYNIERIADNATNIAEAAIYLMEGKDVRHG